MITVVCAPAALAPTSKAVPITAWRKCVISSSSHFGTNLRTPGRAEGFLRAIPARSSPVPLQRKGGTYVVPVLINKAITLDFVVDGGAADVSIPADVVMTLVRTGTLQESDFIGTQTYKLADGSTVPSTTFRIRSLTTNKIEIENVRASIAPPWANVA